MRLPSLAAAAVLGALIAGGALTASAGIVRVAPQPLRLAPPAQPAALSAKRYSWVRGAHYALCCSPLFYGGGPVLGTPHMYLILWGYKKAGDPDKIAKLAKAFVKNLGGSPWFNIVTQYYSGSASSPVYIANPKKVGTVWADDTNPVPLHPTDAQVQTEAAVGVAHFGFDANGSYIVMSPYKNDPTGFVAQGWCAYHGVTTVKQGIASYINMPYMPDGGRQCGGSAVKKAPSDETAVDEGETIELGHEFAEVTTDPQPTSGWNSTQDGEIADECTFTNIANEPIGKATYTMQPLFSNASRSCVMSYTP
jgi:hypothetical protein